MGTFLQNGSKSTSRKKKGYINMIKILLAHFTAMFFFIAAKNVRKPNVLDVSRGFKNETSG